MKSKLSIPGIIGSLVVVGGALLYTQFKSENYTLPTEWEPSSNESIQYSYVYKLPDRKGGYRVVDCYTVEPFKNVNGETVETGCIAKYKLEAICEKSSCTEVNR